MKQIILDEIVDFSLGKNPTRIKDLEEDLYTPEDFEKDLHCNNDIQEEQGCIISLIKSKASPVSLQTDKKCITSNFLKCDFDKNVLDPWYFCYQFNEGKEFDQQITMYHQGTFLSVKKLTVKIISELKMNLPDIEKQREIGLLYRQSIIQYDLLSKQAENIKRFTLSMIRKIEEDL